jgi:hypothetical protein
MNLEHTTTDKDGAGRGSRRPPFDVASFVAGIVVLALAAAFAYGDLDSVRDQARIIWPIALLGIGLGFLAGAGHRR